MSQFPRLLFAMLAVSHSLPGVAEGAPVTIANPSFENPVTAAATFSGAQAAGPAGWTVYNAGATNGQRFFGVWNPATTNSYIDPVPEGANLGVVFLNNTTNLAEAGLRQVLSATLQLSTHYTLTVAVGNFAPETGSPYDFTGFPGYRVELFAGSTLLAMDDNTLLPAEGRFLTSTFTVTTGASHALAGQPLAIRLVNLNGAGVEVNFDRVQLDAVAVPEPASAALVALGALLAVKRRRQIHRLLPAAVVVVLLCFPGQGWTGTAAPEPVGFITLTVDGAAAGGQTRASSRHWAS